MIRYWRLLGLILAAMLILLGILSVVGFIIFQHRIPALISGGLSLAIAYRMLRHRYFPTKKERQ